VSFTNGQLTANCSKHSGAFVTGTEYFNQIKIFSQDKTKRIMRVEISFRLEVIHIQLPAALKHTGNFVHAPAVTL
jgi:hypothetical protein